MMVAPRTEDEICEIVNKCRECGIPFFVMGNGSNLLVRDKGLRCVVVKLFKNFSGVTVKGDVIEAQAGLLLSKASNAAMAGGLSGLEFAAGIPGTVGGAIVMNAGAYGGEMKDVVVRTRFIDELGNIKVLCKEEHQFAYRTSYFQQKGGIVLSTVMELKRGSREDIKALMDEFNRRRACKQPLEMPSAGSVFKRPEGYFTGKLIEDSGLKGFRIGGAEVSGKHCGFIVNAGGATAEDVIRLIEHIQACILKNYGVELESEIKVIGEQ